MNDASTTEPSHLFFFRFTNANTPKPITTTTRSPMCMYCIWRLLWQKFEKACAIGHYVMSAIKVVRAAANAMRMAMPARSAAAAPRGRVVARSAPPDIAVAAV